MKYFVLFVLFAILNSITSLTNVKENLMISQCNKYRLDLFKLSSQVNECFIKYSSSISMCKQCGTEFYKFLDKYTELQNKSQPNHKYCSSQLIHHKSFAKIRNNEKEIKSQWSDANCPQCYENNNDSVTSSFAKFMKYKDAVMTCLGNYTDADTNYKNNDYEEHWGNKNYSVIACHMCRRPYEIINTYYIDRENDINKQKSMKVWREICGDMAALRNMTRFLWSNRFKCDSDNVDKMLHHFYWEKIVLQGIKIKLQEHKIENITKFLKTANDDSRSRIDKLERIINQNINLNKIEGFEGIILTVDKFDARKTKREDIFSPYFYSHWNGYKLKLNVMPRGYNEGRYTHLSVGIRIYPGEYDDRLSWPCKYRFEVSVVNQRTGETHNAVTVSYDTVPNIWKDKFNKPKTDSSIYWNLTFVSHSALRTIDGLTVNDCVIIKCVVRPPP